MNFPMLKATRGTIMLFVVIFVPRQKKNNNAVLCRIIVDHVLYERGSFCKKNKFLSRNDIDSIQNMLPTRSLGPQPNNIQKQRTIIFLISDTEDKHRSKHPRRIG